MRNHFIIPLSLELTLTLCCVCISNGIVVGPAIYGFDHVINTATKMLKVAKVGPERELHRSRFDVGFAFSSEYICIIACS